MFFNGTVNAMKPKVSMFKGKINIIRPLCYLEKSEIEQFSQEFDFPDTQYVCPHGQDSSRKATKKVIESLSKDYPFVKTNIFRSLKRIRKDYLV